MNPSSNPNPAVRPLPFPIEVAVLLPIGALANLFDPKEPTNPQCVERGRDELAIAATKVSNHLLTAKGTGQLAIAFGVPMLQRRLLARIDEARGRPPRPEPAAGEWPQPAQDAPPAERVTPGDAGESSPDIPAPASVDVQELAIPGYDTLSASQIVERLDGLSLDDRQQLRDYELAHRNRRTVLGKIDQLQATGT